MFHLAASTWQLEFMGQTTFAWWTLVAMVSGLALLGYSLLLLHDGHKAKAAGGPAVPDAAHPTAGALAAPYRSPKVAGLPTALVAAAAGVATLAVTLSLIVLQTPPHAWALGWTLLTALFAVWLFYQRVFTYLSRPRIAVLFVFRFLAVAGLLTLLFEPFLGMIQRPESRQRLAIVLDGSGSMSTVDQVNEPDRYRQSVLAIQNTLVPALQDLYDVQFFVYDGQHPQPLRSGAGGEGAQELERIAPRGTVTDLAAAVGLATSSGANRVVLFSDGIHNGPTPLASSVGSIAAQVYTVKVGSSSFEQSTVPDIAVTSVDGPQTTTVNNQITLTAVIKSTALSDRTIKVLLSQDDRQLDEQRLVLRSGPLPQTVQLKFSPERVGRTVVRVSVPVDPAERNEANNQQDFPMIVTDPKLAVLYIEGRVRPEVRFLRRVLEQDPNINAISMVQTQGSKFELRGAKPGDDLAGIPQTLAQWRRFKVIMLGDLDSSFLNAQQQRDLAQTVKDGAGLLMIGGQNSFAPGKWDNTTLADLLPVTLTPVQPAQIDTPFVPQLTAAGTAHPIFRNIAGFFLDPTGKSASQTVPNLLGCVALAGVKPGGTVLAVHPSAKVAGQPAIVMAVQQYGKARTAAFAGDTTWQWQQMLVSQGKDSPYNRFWGQLVRWLAGQEDLQKKTGPSVTAMIPKERYEAAEQVLLRCAVTDKDGQSTKFAQVTADIKGPDAKTTHVDLLPVENQIGVYEGQHFPTLAGTYEVVFKAAKDDAALGQDKSTFMVLQSAGEMDVLAANPANMQLLAINGGGYQELTGPAMRDLADRLVQSAGGQAQESKKTFPIYNRSLFGIAALLIVCLLTAEWFLRRKWQLQ